MNGGAAANRSIGNDPLANLRLDRINSRELLRDARIIYFRFLESGWGSTDPLGVVMAGVEGAVGRVVFDLPVLLPHECFVPLELLRLRPAGRPRSPRAAAGRPAPPSGATPLRPPSPVRAAGDV
ncbi:hypothetical protein NZK32_02470 [Cyanobium sp. FGCU-52]|nr:hypothetical protein [Cyanobium sp. FGCU52]